jgi:hypothetical protein
MAYTLGLVHAIKRDANEDYTVNERHLRGVARISSLFYVTIDRVVIIEAMAGQRLPNPDIEQHIEQLRCICTDNLALMKRLYVLVEHRAYYGLISADSQYCQEHPDDIVKIEPYSVSSQEDFTVLKYGSKTVLSKAAYYKDVFNLHRLTLGVEGETSADDGEAHGCGMDQDNFDLPRSLLCNRDLSYSPPPHHCTDPDHCASPHYRPSSQYLGGTSPQYFGGTSLQDFGGDSPEYCPTSP